ncbi:uncharacterized protein LOC142530874 [Primulina tabacum]|uniref:uncharacterized protein LOC142530874 n=1 Tax=Primulina tabacum TaxID=48773 RepID=UPI003F592312
MAEESTDSLLLIPEKNEMDSLNIGKNSAEYSDSVNEGDSTDSPHETASTGICHKRDDSRSNSTEKLKSANRKKVPHYLRASTGSCHDLCKHGRKHEFEEKARTPLRIRIAKMSPTEQNGVGKKNSPGLQPSPDIKFVSPKLKPSLDHVPVSSRKNASSGNKIPLTKHKISPGKKTPPTPDPPEVIKRKTLWPSRNLEVTIEHGSLSDSEMLTTEKKTGCLTKKHSAVHLKSVKDKMISPTDSLDGINGTLRRNSDFTPVKRATEMKTYAQKEPTPLIPNSFPKISLSKTISTPSRKARNLAPFPNNQNKILRTNAKTSINEQVSGKTLHVIKTRSNAKAPPLSTHIKDVDRGTHKFVLDKNKLDKTGKAPSLTQNANKTPRKSRMIVSDDKYRSPVKLKFKSGKVADIQSDNNTPRRLKFRRARINTTNVGISSVKVVLKHQDVQGRKDAQGLFNNVIEETISKLVESRKSKVKALVGAFETVISLQDGKPSSHTVKLSGD